MMSTCTVCGRVPREAALRSIRGELTCTAHPSTASCTFCGRPAGRGEQGWTDLAPRLRRCPTCADDAVATPEALRGHVPGVRQITRDLGFALASRVQVVFATPGELPAGADDRHGADAVLGHTKLRVTGARSAEATIIQLQRGLPAFMFGRVLAHELGHAWLAQLGARPLSGAVEEGVCELLSYAWLKRSGVPFAEAVRDRIRANPDPVYGNGFRDVHKAVRRHGIAALVASLSSCGQLPTGPGPEKRQVLR